jgi:hypothetical protein
MLRCAEVSSAVLCCALPGLFLRRGVEARVPFLDRRFLDVAMAIDPAEKMIDKSKGEAVVQGLDVLGRYEGATSGDC